MLVLCPDPCFIGWISPAPDRANKFRFETPDTVLKARSLFLSVTQETRLFLSQDNL